MKEIIEYLKPSATKVFDEAKENWDRYIQPKLDEYYNDLEINQ